MLSIVIITCNRADELINAVISCERHVSIEHEYVIIDNGSTDDTKDKIERLTKSENLNMNYRLQSSNLGVSGGRNEGYRQAKGDICYFIDDDAVIVSDGYVLDDAHSFMRENVLIYAMGTDCYDTVYNYNLRGLHQIGVADSAEGIVKHYIGCSHFIRKSFCNEDYLYPHNLMYGAEEFYIGFKVFKLGGQVWYYSKLKILHTPSQKTRYSIRENLRNIHINTYVIKKYFIPLQLRVIVDIMFFLRILRFEKCNLSWVIKDVISSKKRYDKTYINRITIKQTQTLCKMYGFLHIL